jgi:hypothetical protein
MRFSLAGHRVTTLAIVTGDASGLGLAVVRRIELVEVPVTSIDPLENE